MELYNIVLGPIAVPSELTLTGLVDPAAAAAAAAAATAVHPASSAANAAAAAAAAPTNAATVHTAAATPGKCSPANELTGWSNATAVAAALGTCDHAETT